MSPRPVERGSQDVSPDTSEDASEDADVVDLDLHCVPDREHCVRLDDAHLDAVHVEDV